jgi:hypothetical protein
LNPVTVLTREVQFLSILLSYAKRSFFLRPPINFFTLESQQVSHTRVRERMFIFGPLGPLHYSSGDRLTTRIDELPITSELRRRHPLGQWFGRAPFDISVRLN